MESQGRWAVWHPGTGTFIDSDDETYLVAVPAQIWDGQVEDIESYLRLRTGSDSLLPPRLREVIDIASSTGRVNDDQSLNYGDDREPAGRGS
jgi:hypothetical protein